MSQTLNEIVKKHIDKYTPEFLYNFKHDLSENETKENIKASLEFFSKTLIQKIQNEQNN